MQRHYTGNAVHLPEYHLSVSSFDLDERQARWEQERMNGKPLPAIEPHAFRDATDPRIGKIVTVSSDGTIVDTQDSDGVQGILNHQSKLLSARHGQIDSIDMASGAHDLFATSPQYNDLHSMRHTADGILAASTGTDAIFELSPDGSEVLWSWHARDDGYNRDSFGDLRPLSPRTDHTTLVYDTWFHTTHVNSALEVGSKVLATLFHQNSVIAIDRDSHRSAVLAEGLKRPHALRQAEGFITFANTAAGLAVKATLADGKLDVLETIQVPSHWLQDVNFMHGYYYLLDGENSRVIIMDRGTNVVAIDQHDPRAFVYEVEPCLPAA